MNLSIKWIIPLLMLILLSAETPHEGEYAEMLLTAGERELDELAKELVQLDSSEELQELMEQKTELEQEYEDAKKLETKVNEYHKVFQKIKIKFKSLKIECTFRECQNVLRYTVTNNSDMKITNISYRILIKNNGKLIYSSTFKNEEERAILPGASLSRASEFNDYEMYDMVIPKGASISMTLVAVQENFENWYEDMYDDYKQMLASLKEKQIENSNAIKQYHITVDARKKEITKRITQLKQQEAAHVSFEE